VEEMTNIGAGESSFEKVIPCEDFPVGQKPKEKGNFWPEILSPSFDP
jgi:hypothetical protein